MPDSGGRGLGTAVSNVRLAWGNSDVRRVQAGFLGSEMGEWAYAMAILVWAYQAGGAPLVGTWAGIRLLLAAFGAPIGGMIADRMSRRVFMMASSALRLVLALAVAAGMHWDAVGIVLVAGTLHALVGASFRPTQSGLIPSLVTTPKQLTAANATAEIVDSHAAFLGPALGGLLLSVFGFVPVVLVNAAGYLWSLLLLARVTPDRPSTLAHTGRKERITGQLVGGFRILIADRGLVVVTVVLGVNGLFRGVLGVLLVLIAAEWVGDATAVGWMNAVLGGAIVVGSLLVLGMAGRVPLGRFMILGALGWSVPMLMLGVVPELVMVIVALVAIGLCDPMLNIGVGTVPQRLAPTRMLSRVFAAIESVFIGFTALGAFLTPVLVAALDVRGAALVFGAVGLLMTIGAAIGVRGLDSRLAAPRGLDLIEQVPLFQPLNPIVIEQIAHRLRVVSVPAEEAIVTEGGRSDRLYVIESGEVDVTQGKKVLRREGAGDVFGEIGLLHDVPRTATVTAASDVVLLTLSRGEFLRALSGEPRAREAAEDLASRRLSS